MKKKDLIKTKVNFKEAKITVGQLQIISTGAPSQTIIRLDGVERRDVGRVDITIDARLPLATVSLHLVPGPQKKEAA